MTQLVLFDLDGTLMDTAPDLGLALNMQRERHGLQSLPQSVIRPYASHGSKGLLSIGFGITPLDSDFEAKRLEYLALYEEVFKQNPKLFDGVAELLSTIERRNLQWGIVTNKPRRFTQPLLQAAGLLQRAAAVVSGDDAALPKPAPDTLLLACQHANLQPADAIYIGDAERDIQAGKAAGMKTVIALYGYLDAADKPDEWQADHRVRSPEEILNLI